MPVYTSTQKFIIITILTIVIAAAGFQRNSVWVTKLDLWTDVANKTPGKSRVHNSLGNCYMLLGNHFKAVQEYRVALELDKGNLEAYYNMATNLEKIGLVTEAFNYYLIFCRLNSPDYQEAVHSACERVSLIAQELKIPVPEN